MKPDIYQPSPEERAAVEALGGAWKDSEDALVGSYVELVHEAPGEALAAEMGAQINVMLRDLYRQALNRYAVENRYGHLEREANV